MSDYITDDFAENDSVSFEKLVLRYIFEDDYTPDECDDIDDEIMDIEEIDDYLSLAEYYYSR